MKMSAETNLFGTWLSKHFNNKPPLYTLDSERIVSKSFQKPAPYAHTLF